MLEKSTQPTCLVLVKCTIFLVLDPCTPICSQWVSSVVVELWDPKSDFSSKSRVWLPCHSPIQVSLCLLKHLWLIYSLNIGHQSKVDCVWFLFSLSSWWPSKLRVVMWQLDAFSTNMLNFWNSLNTLDFGFKKIHPLLPIVVINKKKEILGTSDWCCVHWFTNVIMK